MIIKFTQDKLHLHFADDIFWIDGPAVTGSWIMNDDELNAFLNVANKWRELKQPGYHDRDSYADEKLISGTLIALQFDEEYMFGLHTGNAYFCFRIKPDMMPDFVKFLSKESNRRVEKQKEHLRVSAIDKLTDAELDALGIEL